MSKATSNSSKKTQDAENPAKLDPEILGKIVTLRSQVRESFGKIVMALMGLPRYRHLSLCDLQPMILEPLIRDRLAIAQPKAAENSDLADIAGFAIWASVSEEVRRQTPLADQGGLWPVRSKPADWASGEINWLFDVIAPDRKITGQVIANFKQVIKEGDLRLHPLVARLVEPEMLEKMGAMPRDAAERPDENAQAH